MINLILFLCFVPLIFIIYFMLRSYVKPKNNILLGVTLPLSAHKEEEIIYICRQYLSRLKLVMLPLIILAIPPYFFDTTGAILAWFLCWTILALLLPAFVYAKHRKLLLELKEEKDWYIDKKADEDAYWIWGYFYKNPNNNKLFIKAMYHKNVTMNMAKPAGKVIMFITLLLILCMPLLGLWLYHEEVAPIKLVLSESTLTAHHIRDRYVIQLDAIESLELAETLPHLTRLSGMGLDNLKRGMFRSSEYGTVRVLINPQNPPFLLATSSGNVYILSDDDNSYTREVYAILSALLQLR